jgi:hypothetical protein
MINLSELRNLRLPGGFVLRNVEMNQGPMLDPIGRSALAKTQIVGSQLTVTLQSSLGEEETSVTLYHEILEAMLVACAEPSVILREFNEGDFERAAYECHNLLGSASGVNLVHMLHLYGFREE